MQIKTLDERIDDLFQIIDLVSQRLDVLSARSDLLGDVLAEMRDRIHNLESHAQKP